MNSNPHPKKQHHFASAQFGQRLRVKPIPQKDSWWARPFQTRDEFYREQAARAIFMQWIWTDRGKS